MFCEVTNGTQWLFFYTTKVSWKRQQNAFGNKTYHLDATYFDPRCSCTHFQLYIRYRCYTQSVLEFMETSQQQTIFRCWRTCSVWTDLFPFEISAIIKIWNFSRAVWESNLKIVQEHNLDADLGLHSYWLGMNAYADLVYFYLIYFDIYIYFLFLYQK
jgi:hypothetical protein